ncbi:hypothetical protein [Hansschlegelia sp.]|uniref:hypothetical protein n=1 Tax=Hansschlegelia sp. TaxID=2041892 RepID=UPI002CFBD284|nr:hypothetical protein [Hansschlegelia sp.]HVI28931.1 hypothetical protein [Hansschlegelia sp.]
MSKLMKAVASGAFAAGLAIAPLAAIAQEQPARSTGDTDNAQDQRTNEQVRRTPPMGGSEKPTGPSGTSTTSNDEGAGVHPVPQAPAGAGSAATSGGSGSKPMPHTDTRN